MNLYDFDKPKKSLSEGFAKGAAAVTGLAASVPAAAAISYAFNASDPVANAFIGVTAIATGCACFATGGLWVSEKLTSLVEDLEDIRMFPRGFGRGAIAATAAISAGVSYMSSAKPG